MAIHKFNSFRRYTPPTCTLEIYHPQPFWGRWRNQSFPPLFSFQLNFDDPRLTQEDKISIIGDRDLLEKLRIEVVNYVSQYLNDSTLLNDNLSCPIGTTDEPENIYISRKSTYSHFLYYQSFEPHQETIGVILSNTQLFDLINALETYHQDVTAVRIKPEKRSLSFGMFILIAGFIATIGGFLWSYYGQKNPVEIAEEIPNSSNEKTESDIHAVIPPSPLNLDSLDENIVLPKIPQELINQQSLLPPLPTFTQPPNHLIISDNHQSTNNHSAIRSIISSLPINQTQPELPLPPKKETVNESIIEDIQDSFVSENLSNSPVTNTTTTTNNNLLISLSSLPVLSSDNLPVNQDISTSSDDDKSKTIVKSSPMNNLSNPSITNREFKFNSNSQKQLISLNPSIMAKKISQDKAKEVKQYFEDKWQPPENLKQSIEYRLILNENGVLIKVTPIGQIAAIFLDKTPIPITNEVITSSFSPISDLRVRLVLTPNGVVQAFTE